MCGLNSTLNPKYLPSCSIDCVIVLLGAFSIVTTNFGNT